ncbi:MAG: tetratricopeptide repeat protein [Acidobacteria bacterium]|nr:tetratricopeptide repeat protein [Acidobacteriota bacterium]
MPRVYLPDCSFTVMTTERRPSHPGVTPHQGIQECGAVAPVWRLSLLGLALMLSFGCARAQEEISALRAIWATAQRGEGARALQLARGFIGGHPLSAEGLDLAGVLATGQGIFEEARGYLWRAVRIRPDSPRILTNLGFVYLQEGNPSRAVSLFRAALLLDPGFSDGWKNLAGAFAMLGDRPAERAALDFGPGSEKRTGARRGLPPGEREAGGVERGDHQGVGDGSPCMALVRSLKESPAGARLVALEGAQPCSEKERITLSPDVPVVLKFNNASRLTLEAAGEDGGAWVFWASRSGHFSGSAQVDETARLEVALPEGNTLVLTASRPLQLQAWSVR